MHRINLHRWIITVLIPICIAYTSPGTSAPVEGKSAVIMATSLNVRSGPDVSYKTIAKLSKGDQIKVLSEVNGWFKIEFKEQTGYIQNQKQYVEYLNPEYEELTKDFPNIEANKDQINEKLKNYETRLHEITQEESKILNDFHKVDLILNQTRKEVSDAKNELSKIKAASEDTEKVYQELQKKISKEEGYASERLVALYKLFYLGRVHVLASADSVSDFFYRKDCLEQILKEDAKLLHEFAEKKEKLSITLSQLNAQKKEKQSAEENLNAKISKLKGEHEKRSIFLKEIQTKKNLQMASIQALRDYTKNLNTTLDRLKQHVVEPKMLQSNKPFASLKGFLMMPATGEITSFFGLYENPEFGITNFHSGIKIQVDRGEPVKAVYGGETLFSNWLKGYGNMIIIDHGEHYYTVYAHLEEVFKKKGDSVDAGEVIATAGDTGSISGSAGLHFEVRHRGEPLDPLQWIKKDKRS